MKGFLVGVASTILAGLAIFLAQTTYSDWREQNKKSLFVRIDDDLVALTPSDADKIAKLAKTDARIAVFKVTNRGNSALIDSKIHVGTQIQGAVVIFTYGSAPDKFTTSDSVELKSTSSGFDVILKSIASGATQKFWVAYQCCEMFSASSRESGLQLTQSLSDMDEIDDDPVLWWIGTGLVLFVGVVSGSVLAEVVYATMLKRRGIDIKALLKNPIISEQETNDA